MKLVKNSLEGIVLLDNYDFSCAVRNPFAEVLNGQRQQSRSGQEESVLSDALLADCELVNETEEQCREKQKI